MKYLFTILYGFFAVTCVFAEGTISRLDNTKKSSILSQAGFQRHRIYHYADHDLLELVDNDLSSSINHIAESFQSINLNNAIELTKSKNTFSNSAVILQVGDGSNTAIQEITLVSPGEEPVGSRQ